MSMEDYKKLVNRLRDEPKDSRKAVLSIYDLCIDAAYAIEILLDKLKHAEAERDAVTRHMIELEQEVCRLKARLADYEDTGLEPEEIADAVIAAKMMAKSKIVSCFGVDADHILELVHAEQDGHMVVLPCKVGDTVYQIDAERVYESEVKWIIFDCDDIAFDERAIGGSIFLTREEAEAALAQKGGDG